MKSISVFGVTGSVGKDTLAIIKAHSDKFTLFSCSCFGSNPSLIINIINEFSPKYIAIVHDSTAQIIKEFIASNNLDTTLISGQNSNVELASIKADIFISAIVGISGLRSTIKMLEHGTIVGIVNKESIVCAGQLLFDVAKKYSTTIIPVDSEHSFTFRSIQHENYNNITQILMLASGGPFLNTSISELETITVAQAQNHPIWKNMGQKISIDCATMVNKSLEMIETHYLFDISHEKIDIMIQPKSVIHSYVSFIDGSIKLGMSKSDMRIPIAYALSYPEILPLEDLHMNLIEVGSLEFFPLDKSKFPVVDIAKNTLKLGGVLPIVFNSSNEIAVSLFLENKIKFTDISRIIASSIDHFINKTSQEPATSIDEVFNIHHDALNFCKIISATL